MVAEITDIDETLRRITTYANAQNIRITQHAHQEMADEDITIDEVLEAIASGEILENYPEHRRGACCLISGLTTKEQRPLHIVCTTTSPVVIIITVYEPRPPKWITPAQRRQQI
ncbi:MAG: DUF4258 domain-containing protein [Nitrospirae bacterium]|nr:DUF4258 domain-containing protein [Nitrospirota bacterium]MBF0534747.1 DUF4258 domain-containing protein [Nitrospirota bacterium]MBF0616421.1 DUF4258 domain-containing protein [Nitrospirota bacterium]